VITKKSERIAKQNKIEKNPNGGGRGEIDGFILHALGLNLVTKPREDAYLENGTWRKRGDKESENPSPWRGKSRKAGRKMKGEVGTSLGAKETLFQFPFKKREKKCQTA